MLLNSTAKPAILSIGDRSYRVCPDYNRGQVNGKVWEVNAQGKVLNATPVFDTPIVPVANEAWDRETVIGLTALRFKASLN